MHSVMKLFLLFQLMKPMNKITDVYKRQMFEDWKKAQGQKPDDFEEDDTPYAEEVK